jgi:5-methylcytosine-specific restriction endonuclease McrA
VVSDFKPYPKSEQVKRGKERRTFRTVANRQEWARIVAEKRGPCRICGTLSGIFEFHHILPRSQGGSDCASNVVCLCRECHSDVTHRKQAALDTLAAKLTDDEYAYIVQVRGEGGLERLFGIRYAA